MHPIPIAPTPTLTLGLLVYPAPPGRHAHRPADAD
jgi:hypothetical protein